MFVHQRFSCHSFGVSLTVGRGIVFGTYVVACACACALHRDRSFIVHRLSSIFHLPSSIIHHPSFIIHHSSSISQIQRPTKNEFLPPFLMLVWHTRSRRKPISKRATNTKVLIFWSHTHTPVRSTKWETIPKHIATHTLCSKFCFFDIFQNQLKWSVRRLYRL